MNKKLAIILSGGGLVCSYSAGVMLALVKEYKLTEPDILIAGSGGAGTASYYVAKQYSSIINIWSNLLSTKKFINLFRLQRIMDIDYLIDVVFKKQDPLDAEKIKQSKTNYLIPVINYDTGELEYLDSKKVDIFEAMRATKAMPLIYNKQVEINKKRYCDTFLTSSPDAHIEKARELGAGQIIIIDSTSVNRITSIGFNLWLLFRNREFKKNYLTAESNIVRQRNEKNIIRIQPDHMLQISTLNNSRQAIIESIRSGYSDCKSCQDLKKSLCVNSAHSRGVQLNIKIPELQL